jgi:hypothetical protein
MLINLLHISCLEVLGLIERAELTCSQRRQLSHLLICELLPRTSNGWNLSAARKRQLLAQLAQLKEDLKRRLPQKTEFTPDANLVYRRSPPRLARSAEMRLSCTGGILAVDNRILAAHPARRVGRFLPSHHTTETPHLPFPAEHGLRRINLPKMPRR